MARQKSEDCDKPQARRKPGVTREVVPRAGGEAVPVDEGPVQLVMFSESADSPTVGGRGGAAVSREPAAPFAVPLPLRSDEPNSATTMDEVRRRLYGAFCRVERNRGAPGPDGKTLDLMHEHLQEWLPALDASLADGTYRPGEIRRVWIPKAGGGKRGLGIPNVIDRVVQEAVRQVLEPEYEPTFHASSHGFRPGRSCHTAIAEAKRHVEAGYEWVVDIDLEKFFDRVNHQRLMSKLAQRVQDKAVLVLIGRMLKAKVVMPDGVVEPSEEGVPQGGPLSPLLSNIVLHELDEELDRRGHRFVRYADDCNIYVRSEHAGQRVMANVRKFIERRLRLKVNESKSAVARPEERHFVGFRLWCNPKTQEVEVMLSKRSKERVGAKLRELLPRNYGNALDACIRRLNEYLRGWLGFFGVCTAEQRTFYNLDTHIRRRLRAIQLAHWKRKRTIVRNLIKRGIKHQTAWRSIYGGRKSLWALSHASAVDLALRNSHWDARGLISIEHLWRERYAHVAVPVQLALGLG
jgi:RNA-directed DNA polymerase